jgi:hypothetical protein
MLMKIATLFELELDYFNFDKNIPCEHMQKLMVFLNENALDVFGESASNGMVNVKCRKCKIFFRGRLVK